MMITSTVTIETLVVEVHGLAADELERWIGRAWVRPEGEPGAWRFREIDVARVRLIRELRQDLHVGDETLPLVLSLLDQLYDERRRLRRIRDALDTSDLAHARDLVRRLLGNGDSDAAFRS